MQKLIFFISSLLVLAILSACGNEGNVDEDDFSSYPEENITLIVPWGAGGDTDIIARTVNKYLEEELDTTIVTQNIGDRKSTRLNSSHVSISYAVFCLKNK